MNDISIETIDRFLVSHRLSCQKADRTLHTHNNAYEIMLFKYGNVDYFINDTAYPLVPGDLTFIRPNDIHGMFIRDDSPYERLPIHLELHFASSLCTPETDLLACFRTFEPNHVCHLDPVQAEEYEYYVDMIIDSINKQSYGSDVLVKSCLSIILLMANSVCRSKELCTRDISPKIIRDAISYINDNLTDDITIQTAADSLCISRSRLSHLFKEFTGTSLWNYIIARRIQHAKKLLENGATITAACYDSGFQDYSHFVKVFSKTNGISPGKYAKLNAYEFDDSDM